MSGCLHLVFKWHSVGFNKFLSYLVHSDYGLLTRQLFLTSSFHLNEKHNSVLLYWVLAQYRITKSSFFVWSKLLCENDSDQKSIWQRVHQIEKKNVKPNRVHIHFKILITDCYFWKFSSFLMHSWCSNVYIYERLKYIF